MKWNWFHFYLFYCVNNSQCVLNMTLGKISETFLIKILQTFKQIKKTPQIGWYVNILSLCQEQEALNMCSYDQQMSICIFLQVPPSFSPAQEQMFLALRTSEIIPVQQQELQPSLTKERVVQLASTGTANERESHVNALQPLPLSSSIGSWWEVRDLIKLRRWR